MAQRIEMDEYSEEQPKPVNLRKLILIVFLVFAIVFTGLAFGGYYFVTGQVLFGLDKMFEEKPAEATLAMEPFLVNLQADGRDQYLKATVAIGYQYTDHLALLEGSTTQIRDVVIQYLRSKSGTDFSQEENLEPFKEELKAQLNGLFEEDIVYRIYFTEFLIQ